MCNVCSYEACNTGCAEPLIELPSRDGRPHEDPRNSFDARGVQAIREHHEVADDAVSAREVYAHAAPVEAGLPALGKEPLAAEEPLPRGEGAPLTLKLVRVQLAQIHLRDRAACHMGKRITQGILELRNRRFLP